MKGETLRTEGDERLNLTVTPTEAGAATITIIHGEAPEPLPLKDTFQKLGVTADVDGPAIYAQHLGKHNLLTAAVALAIFNREGRTIRFYQNPNDSEKAIVVGKLELDPDFAKLGLNTPKRYSREDLVKFLRMNRALFPDKDAHNTLLAAVRKFEASAQQKVVGANDGRGNKAAEFSQTVTANDVPFDFTIAVPIWKGQPVKSFVVEVCLDITDGSTRFWFESPDAAELEKITLNEIFDAQAERFNDLEVTIISE